uniref:Sphingolipid delta(4)-desaturase n=1 Tax=Blastobotrys adeninivorans TaxID=409370 RepID=A0A060SYC7_BLAAD
MASVTTTRQRQDPASAPSQTVDGTDSDFFYTYQEEPHRSRRRNIIKAHPEVTKLNGHEPLTKYVVTGVVALQLTTAIALRNTPVKSWTFWICAYVIGATCISNLFLAIHELSHNLGFKRPLYNRLFSIFANIPIGIPYSASFGPYHLLHHKFMGNDKYDTDIPTSLEAAVLSNVAGKAFFATFQLFFYAIRPICIIQLDFTWVHFLNVVVQVVVDVAIVKWFGWTPFYYMLASAFLAGSLHPIAGHFIAEHYVMDPPEKYDPYGTPFPETYSYYGPLNILVYNVGLHNEHHDFPYVPWTRLYKLHDIAKEFYDPLPSHHSWSKVIWDFVLDPNVNLWCRVKRRGSEPDQTDVKQVANLKGKMD